MLKVVCDGNFRQIWSGITNEDVYEPATFSWWDYRMGAFRRNRGLRIDHILVSDALKDRCVGARVDREPRTWERPSDHAPVVAQFTD